MQKYNGRKSSKTAKNRVLWFFFTQIQKTFDPDGISKTCCITFCRGRCYKLWQKMKAQPLKGYTKPVPKGFFLICPYFLAPEKFPCISFKPRYHKFHRLTYRASKMRLKNVKTTLFCVIPTLNQ